MLQNIQEAIKQRTFDDYGNEDTLVINNKSLEANLYRNIGKFLFFDGNYDEAIGYLEEALYLYQ